MNRKLYEYLVATVNVESFYEYELGDRQPITWAGNLWCPFHNPEAAGNAPSFSVNRETGGFKCHSCNVLGSNIINFYEQLHGTPLHTSMVAIFHNHVQPIVPDKYVDQCHANLLYTPQVLRWLLQKKGINKETVCRFKLGLDWTNRITVPVINEFGLCVNLRRYDYTGTHPAKMLQYGKGYGRTMLFPMKSLVNRQILLCEGEWDTMLAMQNGFSAVTSTSGVGSWEPHFNELLRNHDITVCFDVNDPRDVGQLMALRRCAVLSTIARSVRYLKLPLSGRGEDLSDYLHTYGHTARELQDLIASAPVVHQDDPNVQEALAAEVKGDIVHEVTLSEASAAKYHNHQIRMTCMVAGKTMSPYMPPKRVRVKCHGGADGDVCDACPLAHTSFEGEFEMDDEPVNLLRMIDCTEATLKKQIRAMIGLQTGCRADIEVTEAFNLEHVQLIPEIDQSDKHSPYVMRDAYFKGHGLEANRTYTFNGWTTAEPKRQLATHILEACKPAQTGIDVFRMTSELRDQLKIFQTTDHESFFGRLYADFAQNVTRIFKRPDLHQAIDLVFHSPLEFNFNGEHVRKGWLECLVIGDTRTGKGFVAEGLLRHYQVGEVISAENCTFAGLVGGMQQAGDKRMVITWGKIPLNDRRIVVLDESSALSVEDIAKMSRLRSEGVAEIVKIQTQRTTSRTRLVWLANPRSGRPLHSYATGVEAVIELVGKDEDVARFDYAVAVAGSEVESSVINRVAIKRSQAAFSSELCHQLVMWCWSRTRDQIAFTTTAVRAVLKHAMSLGRLYSAEIPLVQVESIRIKIAKIAAAVAGRTFSCDETGERLVVTEECVETAVRFLHSCYDKPSMAYDVYSRAMLDRAPLKNERDVDRIIDNTTNHALDFVEGLLEQQQITIGDVGNFTGTDKDQAAVILGALVRQRALKKEQLWFVKKPAFILYLRRKRERLMSEGLPKFVKE